MPVHPRYNFRHRSSLKRRTDVPRHPQIIFILDVDFVPSTTFGEELASNPAAYGSLLAQVRQGRLVVVPAFETAETAPGPGREVVMAAVAGGKHWVAEAFQTGVLAGFQVSGFGHGHNSTDYPRWVNPETQEPYRIQYKKVGGWQIDGRTALVQRSGYTEMVQSTRLLRRAVLQGFEPYVLALRQAIPWYDERFRGYGRDKITHLLHISSTREAELGAFKGCSAVPGQASRVCRAHTVCMFAPLLHSHAQSPRPLQPCPSNSTSTHPRLSSTCPTKRRLLTRRPSRAPSGTMYVRGGSGCVL